MIALASLVAVALAAEPGCGLPSLAPGARPWQTGETLTFDLDLLGMVKTGTLAVAVERPMSGGAIVPLRARAKSTASVASVRKLAGVAISWVSAATLLPERYRDESQEDEVHRSTDARLVPGASDVALEETYRDQRGTRTYPRHGTVLDAVSALYYLRAAALVPGERFCFDLVATGRYWRVEGSAVKRTERVETPAGRFDALRIDATARRADRPDAKREIHLWISADPRRLPVAAVSEIDLGPVRALLSSVRGARAP